VNPGREEHDHEQTVQGMKRAVIYIDGSDNDIESLASAVMMCRRFGARLNVIHPVADSVARAKARAVVVGQSMSWRYRVISESRSSAARQAFEKACGDVDFAHYAEVDYDVVDAIRHLGLLHDVTILERVSEQEGPKVLALNAALFETGGPVLIDPPHTPPTFGEAIAVAWSGTVQSARVVRSALPLLSTAKKVSVVTDDANPRADAADLVDYLDTHGIKAQTQSFDSSELSARGRGRALIGVVKTLEADMLVMGAYGKDQLDAIFGLGRATQKVITAAPVPVLLQS
jgi:nucleotide-binding universal stress UspA family protein